MQKEEEGMQSQTTSLRAMRRVVDHLHLRGATTFLRGDGSAAVSSLDPLMPLLPRSLSRTALRAQLDAKFWTSYLPGGRTSTTSRVNFIEAAPLVPTLRHLASQDETARAALDACAFIVVGRLESNKVLLQHGWALYGRALCEVNRALQHPVKSHTDGTLAACRLLSFFEALRGGDNSDTISTQGPAWGRHVDGTVTLLDHRGPEKHNEIHSHALFLEARMAAVIAGVVNRKGAALSSGSWRTVPWQGSERTLTDKLFDVFADVTHRVQEQDEFNHRFIHVSRNNIASFTRQGRDLLRRCTKTGLSLCMWEEKAIRRCAEATQYQQQNTSAMPGLEEVVMSHGFGFFELVMQYCIACTLHYTRTWLLLRRLTSQCSVLDPGIHPIPSPERYAAIITQHCSHYFEPDGGLLGAQQAFIPMGIALHYYAATGQVDSPEMDELIRVLDGYKLASLTGDFLRSAATSDPVPESIQGDVFDLVDHVRIATHFFRPEEGVA
ncbi:hypothetical protein LTR81_024260 [Elasticomyces elasticus]